MVGKLQAQPSENHSQHTPTESVTAVVFNIQRYCIHDGPGIRTTVFLKGCSLACWWCANPEAMNNRPELGFAVSRCTGCGLCITACPEGAFIAGVNGKPSLDRDRCTACGECVPVCPPQCLSVYGKEMTPAQVFQEVRKDEIFYRGSGGGVTLSGGEPLLHPLFAEELLTLCRQAGIGTAIETAGYVSPQVMRRVLPLLDTVLFDLKLIDSAAHARVTSKPNDTILENARLVASNGADVLFRMPFIPGINDTPANIRATARFLQGLGNGRNRIELLPYHRLGVGKAEAVGLPNRMEGVTPPEPEHVEAVRAAFEAEGTPCSISR